MKIKIHIKHYYDIIFLKIISLFRLHKAENMPNNCAVVNCGSRSSRDDVKFFRLPMIRKKLLEISTKRQNAWLAAIKRSDMLVGSYQYQRVCAKHFISGKLLVLSCNSLEHAVLCYETNVITRFIQRRSKKRDYNK